MFPNATAPALWLAMILTSTALSYASFQWLERPIVALRRRLRPQGSLGGPTYPSALAGATLAG
jgi:peptidoglycan/LPS O-acetylase OafA/YrhL